MRRTAARWPRSRKAATRRRPAGRGRTSAGCWHAPARSPPREAARAIGVTHSAFRNRRPPAFCDALQAVFPHLDVVIACRLLSGVYSGIVPDGIAGLGTGDWAGDPAVLLSCVKRRTAAESVNLPRPAVRLLGQWLTHSLLLRGLVPPAGRGRLWLGLSYAGKPVLIREIDRVAVQRRARRHDLPGTGGRPLKIRRARIRTTHHAMRDKKARTGGARATIGPNRTPAAEGGHYLSATTTAQRHAIETVIEDARHDLLRRPRSSARRTPPGSSGTTRS